jgi:hypothetical protein
MSLSAAYQAFPVDALTRVAGPIPFRPTHLTMLVPE